MAKPVKKVAAPVVEATDVEVVSEESGVSFRDLSVQKRIELWNKEYTKIVTDLSTKYGLQPSVELVFNPRGIIPRMTLIDELAQKNEGQNPTAATPAKN